MELKHKKIIITGANGGIGTTLVEKLAQEEAELILIQKKISSNSAHKTYATNLTHRSEILDTVEQIKNDYSQVDILINIAGIGIYKPIEEATYDEWDASFALNVTAPFILTKALLPLFNKTDSVVMNIGSGAGVIPMKNRFTYCSTKFALRGLTLSLAEDFKDKKPSFCLVTLGSTLTPFGIGNSYSLEEKIQRNKDGAAYFTPEWVANKLVELLKNEQRENEVVLYPSDYGFGSWKKP